MTGASGPRAAACLPTLVGVDGCRAGWIAALRRPGGDSEIGVHATFRSLMGRLPGDAVIAVDMPIGLPDRIVGPGRAAEVAARSVLKARRSSVFSIPARAAFGGPVGPFADGHARSAAYREACRAARSRHHKGKAFAVQAFAIFPRIVEIDEILTEDPSLSARIVESHPELAFCVLNGGREMTKAKKEKRAGKAPSGEEERMAVLRANGFLDDVLRWSPPRGAGRDDWLDACAMLVVAERYAKGEARSYPDPPERDGHGLPIAIWV